MTKGTANKRIKRAAIMMIAVLVLAMMAVPVSANGYVSSIDITQGSKSVNSVTVMKGKSTGFGYKLTGSTTDTANWKSSNSAVATVTKNRNGSATIKAKKNGTVTITAEVDGAKDTCKVTVKTSAKYINANGCYGELNKYRKARKYAALKKDAGLENIAKIRVKEMAEYNKFSHTRPNGKSGLTLIKGNKAKGENIAMGQRSCAQVTKAWYNSKGHRANMLKGNKASKKFTKVGIAAYEYNGVIYWAQVFSN